MIFLVKSIKSSRKNCTNIPEIVLKQKKGIVAQLFCTSDIIILGAQIW